LYDSPLSVYRQVFASRLPKKWKDADLAKAFELAFGDVAEARVAKVPPQLEWDFEPFRALFLLCSGFPKFGSAA